ncbi:MAG: Rho termination factor N-terminal domain-containing protein, partial [Clostridia bacterium]|nr:Rho termination factor N-terminal domain-containing protein [Clostridia bacterium]
MELDILKDKKVAELREIAAALGVQGAAKLKKKEIVELLTKMHEEAEAAKAAAPASDKSPEAAIQEELKPEEPAEKSRELPENDPRMGAPMKDGRVEKTGILELAEGGFGFLRFDNFLTSDEDVYVSPTQIRRFNLKTGDKICCIARKPGEGERFGALLFVKSVNGDEPGISMRRKDFSDLTPIYPSERIHLEKGSSTLSMRLTDLIAPIGKGQRGLIVA